MEDGTNRVVGSSGYFRASPVQDGNADMARTKIPFVYWSASAIRTFQDETATQNYAKGPGIVFCDSNIATMSMMVDVRGRFRRSSTPATLIREMFGDLPFYAELGFTETDPYVSFSAWIENLEMRVPAEDVVDFSCTLRSRGEIVNLAVSK